MKHILTAESSLASLDNAILYEAHGLIADMLVDPSVPPHILTGLRAVSSLISPASYLNGTNQLDHLTLSSSSSHHHRHNHLSMNSFHNKNHRLNNSDHHSSSLHHNHHPHHSHLLNHYHTNSQSQKRYSNLSTAITELPTCSSSPMLITQENSSQPSLQTSSRKQSCHSSECVGPTRISISLADFSSSPPTSSIFTSSINKHDIIIDEKNSINNITLNSQQEDDRNRENCQKNEEENNEENEENPFLGESKSFTLAKKNRINLRQSLIRRMSTSTWTTTTSATGLPTLEAEPCRKRSTSFRSLALNSPPTNNSQHFKSHSNLKGRSFSATSLPVGVTHRLQMLSRNGTLTDHIHHLHSQSSYIITKGVNKTIVKDSETHEENDADTEEEIQTKTPKSFLTRIGPQYLKNNSLKGLSKISFSPKLARTSDYDSSNDSPSGSELTMDESSALFGLESSSSRLKNISERIQVLRSDSLPDSGVRKCPLCGCTVRKQKSDLLQNNRIESPNCCASLRWPFVELPPAQMHFSNRISVMNFTYDLSHIHAHPLLGDALNNWDYPIFDLSDELGERILSHMTYSVFKRTGLLEAFQIPIVEFFNFFYALENGYRHKPYHNRIHASDVVHGVYYFTSQPIAGLTELSPDCEQRRCSSQHETMPKSRFSHFQLQSRVRSLISSVSASNSRSGSPAREYNERQSPDSQNSSDGVIGANCPALELMALYTAAAMHDYDHPGRTNAFLVTTYSPLAILYNDRSVLENHHAASSWSLFTSSSEFNWLRNLDKAEIKRFRFLVCENILATDLKKHFEKISELDALANHHDSPGIDWQQEGDRMLVMQMIIKLADINGPCKERSLHVKWTHMIAEEFYEQGDEEARLGLTISAHMDRRNPQIPRLQETFIGMMVKPLCMSMNKARLIPTLYDDEEDESGYSHRGRCIQEQHIHENFEYWFAQIRLDLNAGGGAAKNTVASVSSSSPSSICLTVVHNTSNMLGERTKEINDLEKERKE